MRMFLHAFRVDDYVSLYIIITVIFFMKISNLTVENFRSITKANQLPISDLTILIGKNNEGKSNILKALVIGLNQISSRSSGYRRRNIYGRHRDTDTISYDFERDFPLNIPKTENSESRIIIDFEMTDVEKQRLKRITGTLWKENLRIGFTYHQDTIKVLISDTAKLSQKSTTKIFTLRHNIFAWVAEKIEVSYIPAIRDSEKTIEIVDFMIAEQLSVLEYNKKYKSLMSKLAKLQKPILDSMSKSLTEGVSDFLPDVKEIKLDSKRIFQRFSRIPVDVAVNDGNPTDLELKGDGIKSLMAISIIKYLTLQRSAKKNIILAIEEPESHLHPDAIHKLRDVLKDISSKNQVIISTHSPLLTNRSIISKNLLVDKSQVNAAKSIREIRDILGVKIADNLKSANLVILVEGIGDKQILKNLLEKKSILIRRYLEDGTITFDVLEGASQLTQKISMWQSYLCDIYAFLDHDKDGQESFDKAEKNNLIGTKNSTFCILNGFKESEIEDLISLDCYNDAIVKKYGVDLSKSKEFRNNKNKWSIRVRKSFLSNGKRWNEKIESDLKNIVCDNVLNAGFSSINKRHQKPIKSMISNVESYIKNLENK